MKNKFEVAKVDIETGEEIPSTPEEQAAAKEAMRKAVMGLDGYRIELAPGVLEALTGKDMTVDELMAMIAEATGGKQ